MGTLTLLTTLLLLALHTQAESPQGCTEDQKLLIMEDQDISISFTGDKGTALQDADVKSGVICNCRPRGCSFKERVYGECGYNGHILRLCCQPLNTMNKKSPSVI
ncbi:neutrophil defensin 4 precursor [Rattus norvegicus]|uniref:Defensin alpha 11 n=1 Tax=Rattus norvegicus TaxID=10116 RepID=Q4JEI3_RAT|nr:neutrophil defensin 4 precursor [Rattus norvegicus]AAT68754.1 defensin alpha 11 [Rattus norvegicus]AAT68762.1 defensin alpha 11 [Rattus norvegicus]|eukprot:NP_001028250.1 neutrophil defensin 4 precursor [Rattus norvegicus]